MRHLLASFALVVVLVELETLYFVVQNAWFLSDLGEQVGRVVVFYAGSWGALGAGVCLLTRSVRLRCVITATAYYALISLKILGHDTSILAQWWGIAALVAASGTLGLAAWWLERWSRSPLAWFVTVSVYQTALLALAYRWAVNGGSLGKFLLAPGTVLIVFAAAVLALVAARLLARPFPPVALGLLVPTGLALSIAGLGRAASAHPRPSAAAGAAPDLYVFSVDALRKDVFDVWCERGASDVTEVVCRRAVRHEGVITDGIATYQVLARNLATTGDCKSSLPGLLGATHETSMYLGRRGKRIQGSGCFGRYFSGRGRALADTYAAPALFAWSEPANAELRAKYIPTAEMLEHFAREEAPLQAPLFSYLHILDLHNPYVPSRLANDAAHLEAVREFMQLCYWKACDLEQPRSRALVARMREAYLAGITDVEDHLRAFLRVVRDRGRPFVLVVTSDHGELFGEHGSINHSGGFVPELLSIPFSVYDSRKPDGGRDCELKLSSEALAAVAGIRSSSEPTGRRRLSAPPLGAATIDARRGLLEYALEPGMREHRGTWRNVHPELRGTLEWPVPCARPANVAGRPSFR